MSPVAIKYLSCFKCDCFKNGQLYIDERTKLVADVQIDIIFMLKTRKI